MHKQSHILQHVKQEHKIVKMKHKFPIQKHSSFTNLAVNMPPRIKNNQYAQQHSQQYYDFLPL